MKVNSGKVPKQTSSNCKASVENCESSMVDNQTCRSPGLLLLRALKTGLAQGTSSVLARKQNI